MKFGKVDNPVTVDFAMPADDPETIRVLGAAEKGSDFEVFVGCAKWNRADLQGFYPKGTKDELQYYSRQFNCIELNATFYKMPDWKQVETWKNKTPEGFKFFPKLTNTISHYKRLIEVQPEIETFCNAISNFDDRLGMAFLQLHDNFAPKDFSRLETTLNHFPAGIPLAVEVRNEQWFANEQVNKQFTTLLERHNFSNIIVDTAGRRDMLHMRLTSPVAFVRFVGANHSSDKIRLNDWVARIKKWRSEGLQTLYFFVHQNVELDSPLLAAHFIRSVNETFGLSLKVPDKAGEQGLLF